jgi:ureidoacrylate peracid hydrolase
MKKALLVIDAQKIYTNPDSEMFCPDSENTIERINRLIEHFAASGLPIIYVEHVHKADGSDLGRMFDYAGPAEDFNFKEDSQEVEFESKLKIVKGLPVVRKNRYSAFVGTNLENTLKNLNVDTVAICGFMTNFCCESTARDAHDRDYFVDFLTDATGAPPLSEDFSEDEIRRVVSELLAAGFAEVYQTEEYLKS